MICFQIAYTPERSGFLALAIFGFLFGLIQLVRLPSARQAFYLSLATGFAGYATQLGFFWNIFGVSAIALWLILAFWIAAFVSVARLAVTQLGWGRAAFLTPFFWTGLEYFRSELYYLKFSWLNIGFAFAETWFVPWKYVGVYGIGFFAAVLGVVGWFVRAEFLRRIRLLHWVALVVLTAAAVSVLLPSSSGRLPRASFVVAGVQLEFVEGDQILRALDQTLAGAAAWRFKGVRTEPKVDLVVLPEYTLDGEPGADLKDWCRTNQQFLIVGGKDTAPGTNFFDTAFVINTNGEIVFQQAKSVPIQFFKDGLPAAQQKVWESPWGKIGICVCYDLSYARVTDELIKQGAQMIIVPTMDLIEWGRHQHELHARVAPVRAAEYGIPIFRVASSGISQGVDKNGRVQSSAPFPGQNEMIFFGATLEKRGQVPADRLLALLSVGITVIFLLRTVAATVLRKRFAS